MDNIIEPTIDFDFSKLYLASPSSLSGGAYFTRIFLNNKPLYIQTPKCLTKQGFIKSGKKNYTDLMFNNNENVIIQWLENLETKCHELIYSKGDTWFDNKLEKADIESAFTSPIKIFKSGKFYLLRVNVKPNVKIYNEMDQVVAFEAITPEMNIISILEIQGIKFTSRYFQIEMELKQSMIVSPDPFLDECFIKKPMSRNTLQMTNQKTNEVNKNTSEIMNSSNILELDDLHTDDNCSSNDKLLTFQKKNVSQDLPEDLKLDFKDNHSFKNEDVEEINIDVPEELSESDLTEIELNSSFDNNLEPLTLKKPNQVYYNIYKAAREKAKIAKKEAVLAFLEAKNIKTTYMLEGMGDSDSDIDNELDNLEELS